MMCGKLSVLKPLLSLRRHCVHILFTASNYFYLTTSPHSKHHLPSLRGGRAAGVGGWEVGVGAYPAKVF